MHCFEMYQNKLHYSHAFPVYLDVKVTEVQSYTATPQELRVTAQPCGVGDIHR